MDGDLTRDDSGISRPNPDPTVLTTEALAREVAGLKELLQLRIAAEVEARKAAAASLAASIQMQHELREERLNSIDTQLALIERQRVEQKEDVKAAVDAALSAQKEAVKEQTAASGLSIAKSENATNEQIKQLNATFTIAISGVQSTIDDAKERVGKIETMLAAIQGTGAGRSQGWALIIGSIAGISGVVGIVVAIVVLVGK